MDSTKSEENAAFSPHEHYDPTDPETVIPDDVTHTTRTNRIRAVGCEECEYWFLGCLRGRVKWHDDAIMPNHRSIVNSLGKKTLRCDAFTWDHDEERHGRCVVP